MREAEARAARLVADVERELQERQHEAEDFLDDTRERTGAPGQSGANVTILPGRRIGTGSVVGAGAVVASDVPPWSVVAGNPARVVRMRSRSFEHRER